MKKVEILKRLNGVREASGNGLFTNWKFGSVFDPRLLDQLLVLELFHFFLLLNFFTKQAFILLKRQ